jgi:hypothetical protein
MSCAGAGALAAVAVPPSASCKPGKNERGMSSPSDQATTPARLGILPLVEPRVGADATTTTSFLTTHCA